MRHSLTGGSGYLSIDHRDSPGISESELPERLKNISPAVGPNQHYETDTQHCSHCQRIIVLFIVNKKNDIRHRCPYCHHYICRSCARVLAITGQCIPFKKLLDESHNQIQKGQIVLTDI